MPPRIVPENRFKQLVEAATRVFVAQGYRRTQIADVARAMGVGKGTIYLYVESKAALFAVALRYADSEAPAISELDLPLPAPEPGELEAALTRALERDTLPPALSRALDRPRATGVKAELEEIVRELFAVSSQHRTAIELLDRCGADHPELRRIFYRRGRYVQLDALTRYLELRSRRGALRPFPDVAVAARFVIEAVATWAVHIQWDPAPQPIDPSDAEETLVRIVVAGLLKD